jgi:hypothetical protein
MCECYHSRFESALPNPHVSVGLESGLNSTRIETACEPENSLIVNGLSGSEISTSPILKVYYQMNSETRIECPCQIVSSSVLLIYLPGGDFGSIIECPCQIVSSSVLLI